MTEKNIQLPVDVLSYSGLTQLLRNPLMFKLKYVLGVYDGKPSMSNMIGSAGHAALRFYYGGDPDMPVPADPVEARGIAYDIGLKYLTDFPDANIRYGKTGSREKMLAGYAQAMKFYWAEEPRYHEILACEEKMTAEMKTLDGDPLPLPAVGVPDLVHQETDGGIDIIDNKFVKTFTRYENEDGDPHEDYIKIVQAMFFFHLLLAAKGIRARRVLFREIKWTENKDGGPQIRDYVIPTDHRDYHVIFYNLYKDVFEYLRKDPIFLPNLSDPFDGEQAGLLYAQGLISSDMSDVQVVHKVADVQRVHKSFVASRLDRAENQYLPAEQRIKIRLGEFGIPVEPAGVNVGQSVTQYRFKVSAGIPMTRIEKHRADIAAVLAAKGNIRIQAPIPGTELVGIEVENAERTSEKLAKKHLRPGTLELPLGVDTSNEIQYLPLDRAPHVLVAGSTGSGKSVLVSNIITSLSKQLPPEALRLVLIDPKRVELAPYARLPHLHGSKVIYEHDDAVRALMGLTDEMEKRYRVLEKAGKRDIAEYNASKKDAGKRLPYIVAVIDEFADLILRAKSEKRRRPSYGSRTKEWLYDELLRRQGKLGPYDSYTKDALREALMALDAEDEMNRADADFEFLVVRLAQLGRAAGIHIVLATQHPVVTVVTGLIKANFPTRIALTTSSPSDSEVILGKRGAEKLGGKGDMLYRFPGNKGDVRLQGFAN